MDNTKYQVFISSTYADLVEERRKILDILLTADCIPAGMEAFVATDDEQFNVIKRVIDLCDYYILIIGKRYGSINDATGISYTEMEYNYAIDKGIPVLVFAIDDSVVLSDDKIETDDIKKGKLAEFKSRAMRNRLASVWRDTSDLIGKVAIAIMKAKAEINRPGWHRGDNIQSLAEVISLKEENEALKTELSKYRFEHSESNILNILSEKEVTLHYTERIYIFTSNTHINKHVINITLDKLFAFASLRLTGVIKASQFVDIIGDYQSGYYVDEQDALNVRLKFQQLNLIESYDGKDNIEMIKLTDIGKRVMNELNPL